MAQSGNGRQLTQPLRIHMEHVKQLGVIAFYLVCCTCSEQTKKLALGWCKCAQGVNVEFSGTRARKGRQIDRKSRLHEEMEQQRFPQRTLGRRQIKRSPVCSLGPTKTKDNIALINLLNHVGRSSRTELQ